MKKIIFVILLLLSLSLSGCVTIKDEKLIIEKNELNSNEVITMNLSFDYTRWTNKDKPLSFHIQFITGKYLDVRKERYGYEIENDVIYNATKPVEREYYIFASGISSGQEVETIQAVITPNDRSTTKEIQSDFILIKR